MNKFNMSTIAVAASFAFSAGAMAEAMSPADYKVGQDKVAAEYKTAKTACASLSGNANDICLAEAKGKEEIAKAELEHNYKPSVKTQYQLRVAKADAAYAVANERCDDQAGNVKDVCVKEAKAAEISAKADATAQSKITDANMTASDKIVDARKDAAAEKLDAQYRVAKEKCDSYSGTAKENCLADAKAIFGKS